MKQLKKHRAKDRSLKKHYGMERGQGAKWDMERNSREKMWRIWLSQKPKEKNIFLNRSNMAKRSTWCELEDVY